VAAAITEARGRVNDAREAYNNELKLKAQGKPAPDVEARERNYFEAMRELSRMENERDEDMIAHGARKEVDPRTGAVRWFSGAAKPSAGGRTGFAGTLQKLFGSTRTPEGSEYRELIRATVAGDFHSHVFKASGQFENEFGTGGAAVSPEMSRRFWDLGSEESLALRLFRSEPMNSSEKIVPMLDDFNRADDKIAEVQAQWTPEGGTINVETAKIRQVLLKANKLALIVAISRELLEDGDAVGVAREFESAMAAALAARIDAAVFSTGQGSGSPLSILNSPALVEAPEQGGQSGGLVYENLLSVLERLTPESATRYVWFASPTTIPALFRLSYVVGTAGVAPTGVFSSENGRYTLFGRPLFLSAKLPTLGTRGDIVAVDPSQYIVGVRAGIMVQRSEHALFGTDQTAIKATVRFDGRPAWPSSRTDSDGVVRSPFVTVETR